MQTCAKSSSPNRLQNDRVNHVDIDRSLGHFLRRWIECTHSCTFLWHKPPGEEHIRVRVSCHYLEARRCSSAVSASLIDYNLHIGHHHRLDSVTSYRLNRNFVHVTKVVIAVVIHCGRGRTRQVIAGTEQCC